MAGILAIVGGAAYGLYLLTGPGQSPPPGAASGAKASQVASATNPDILMGIDGDPRMTLCTSPAQSPFATPEALAALGLAGPLTLERGEAAAYRYTVLRGPGKPVQSIRFATGTNQRNTATVSNWSGQPGAAPTRDSFEVSYGPAFAIYDAVRSARIWREPKPVMRTIRVLGDAGAIVEVQSDKHKRCIITRYDDERIRPIAEILRNRLVGYLRTTSLDAIVSVEPSLVSASGGGGQP